MFNPALSVGLFEKHAFNLEDLGNYLIDTKTAMCTLNRTKAVLQSFWDESKIMLEKALSAAFFV